MNFLGGVLLGALLAAQAAMAQQFPTKAIRFIVAYPPGGSVDLHARHIGAKMATRCSTRSIRP
jgi:tripartite-type tricarboxylate transporter receptor subunit TctC